jgi:hypothetical protein
VAIEFDPAQGTPPDPDFSEVKRHARLAALYYQELTDFDVPQIAAIDITREWIGQAFDRDVEHGDD